MAAVERDGRTNLDELIAAHQQRLVQLAIRAAKQGDDTPPDVLIEIDRIERELAQLKQAAAYPISEDLIEELGPTGRYQLWMSHVMRLDADIGHLRRDVERLHERFDDLLSALAKRGIRAQKAARRSKVVQ